MHIFRRIAVFLAVLPLLEVAVFALVAVFIGFWNAVLLTLATSVIGAILLRTAGQPRLRQFQSSLVSGLEISGNFGGSGLFTVLAGLLLLLPGFLTDLIAILLLVTPVRRLFGVLLTRVIRPEAARSQPGVVDLEPGEWRDQPQPSLPRHRPDDGDKQGPKP